MPINKQDTSRLDQQLAFVQEIDKLKSIERRNLLISGQPRENTAEHSWHLVVVVLAMMVMTLSEYSDPIHGLDLLADSKTRIGS